MGWRRVGVSVVAHRLPRARRRVQPGQVPPLVQERTRQQLSDARGAKRGGERRRQRAREG